MNAKKGQKKKTICKTKTDNGINFLKGDSDSITTEGVKRAKDNFADAQKQRRIVSVDGRTDIDAV